MNPILSTKPEFLHFFKCSKNIRNSYFRETFLVYFLIEILEKNCLSGRTFLSPVQSILHRGCYHHPQNGFKGSSDPSHFIFETNVVKSRILRKTTLKLNDEFLDRFKKTSFKFRSVLCRIGHFPTLISKNKLAWVWTDLKIPND